MNPMKILLKSISSLWFLLSLPILVAIYIMIFWLSRGEWIYPEQLQTHNITSQNLHSNIIGQSFVARQAGLKAVDLMIDLPDNPSGSLTLYLRTSPNAAQNIQQTTLPAGSGQLTDGWLRFPLEPIPDSYAQYYYFFIEPSADFPQTSVTVYSGAPESYPDGAMYVNGRPQESQLAFRLGYNRSMMLLDLLRSIIASLPRAVISIAAFTLPGWALLVLFQINGKGKIIRHWLEGASASVGLSMAIYPILFLGANFFNWQPGIILVWMLLTTSTLLLISYYKPWRWRIPYIIRTIQAWSKSHTFWADISLMIALGAAAIGRLFMVRGLEMPFWHDSVQHAVITQRIMEAGGLFESWLPYSPHISFSTHFGYHLDTAVFGWITGLDTPQAMLWGGQLFNLFAVFTLYALAYRINGVWAGTIAVLVAGLFTQFPAYYTNWGRYAQMMGQAIVPTAAWWAWATLRHNGTKQTTNIAWIFGGASLITGSILSYYRMAFHYLAFMAAALLTYVQSRRELLAWPKWVTLAGTVATTALMMLPWIGALVAQTVEASIANTAVPQTTLSLWDKIANLPTFWSAPQLMVLLLGTLAILWWGKKVALPTLWFWMIMMLLILRIMPIPGANLISEFAIQTSLYIPMSLIWGTFAGQLLRRVQLSWQWPILILTIAAALLQLPKIPGMLVREWDLSSRPDMQAAIWIKENLPEDAFFLINGFEYKATPAASDAGWWLPLLTKRQTTIPPQYASFGEIPVLAGYRQTTTQLVTDLLAQPPTTPEGKKLICQFPYPITHIYIGQKRGMIRGTAADVTPERPLLPVQPLLEDPAFELLFQQDRVLIFAFNRAFCANE